MNRPAGGIRLTTVAAVLAAALAAALAAWPAARGASETDPRSFNPFAYHVRVVRVAGASDYRGAALGCGRTCGLPIIVPAEEAWGTPAQLAGLARALGGTRADAVTGFIVLPGEDGTAGFEGTVYPGAAALGIRFAARVPASPEAPHDISLTIDPTDGGAPLAEARVLSASDKTVAIAIPSPVDGEWVVVAVTVLDGTAALARVTQGKPIASIQGDVTPPQLAEKVLPRYTPQARKDRREGKVLIAAVIDAEGRVRAPMVLRVDPGLEELAAGAVEAVSQWRYLPATRDGRPIPVDFVIQVEYRLG